MAKKNIEYKIATGKTIKLDENSLSEIENAPRLCIMGDFENLVVDKDINGKPNFGETICSNTTSEEKQKLLFAFYNRFYNPKLATHFIVPETQKEYYQSFMKDWLTTDYDFISRVREKVVYTIGFCATGDEFEKDLKELKSLKAETDDFTDKLVEMSKKYVWLAKVYNIDKTEAKNLIKQGINIIDSKKYKDNLVDVCASNITVTLYRSKEGYFNPDTFAKNFKKSMDAFAQGISNGGKALKYDFILMNPPYNVGGKITKATLNSLTEDGKCICLMPLAQYKPKSLELWRYVESFELADNEMFEDADITKNLCICILKKGIVDKYSWEDLEEASFDSGFVPYYKHCGDGDFISFTGVHGSLFPTREDALLNAKNEYSNKHVFFIYIRTVKDGVHHTTTCYDWKFNNGEIGFMDLPTFDNGGGKSFGLAGGFAIFKSKKSKDNFTTAWYASELFDKALHGLNRDGGHSKAAIPQIDWESISDHPLWKQGDYDGAVLDLMDLKWNEDKTGVVEK